MTPATPLPARPPAPVGRLPAASGARPPSSTAPARPAGRPGRGRPDRVGRHGATAPSPRGCARRTWCPTWAPWTSACRRSRARAATPRPRTSRCWRRPPPTAPSASTAPCPPGSYAVSVRPAGTPVSEPPVLSLTVELEAGQAYTVAGLGTKDEPRLERLVDDLTPPADGSANVRLLPASLAAPTVDVQAEGGPGPGPGRRARAAHRLHRGPRRHVDRAGQRRQRLRHHRPRARPRERLHPARARLRGRQPGRRARGRRRRHRHAAGRRRGDRLRRARRRRRAP